MESSKFKIKDLVNVTQCGIEDKVLLQAYTPKKYFEPNIAYVIKDIGLFTDGWRVLVNGSSQYIHEDYFVSAKKPKSRFELNSETIEGAKNYILCRATQLLRFGYKLISMHEYQWGISAIFTKENETYQSIYILKQYQNQGIYQKNIETRILTSKECGIEDYLIKNNIWYTCENLTPFEEYKIIEDYYGDTKAKRSGVYYMNHIDEGLYILNAIGASEIAKKAYCLHPIVQMDVDIEKNLHLLKNVDPIVVATAIEYRSVANEYLSDRYLPAEGIMAEIRLSPLKDVNDMLIADKIQNKKDFELYHKGKHERSHYLEGYFNNWFRRLAIDENFYNTCFQELQVNERSHTKDKQHI